MAVPFHLAPALAAAGCPTPDPCIAVHLPSGQVDHVSGPAMTNWAAQAVANDQPNAVANPQQYPQRPPPGITAELDPVSVTGGLSVNALLRNLGVNMSTVRFTEMPRPDGTWSILTAGELAVAPNASFQDPTLLPAYYAEAGSSVIGYVRPLTSATDSNLADNEVQGSELDLFVHTGPLLTVTAHASVSASATAKIGQPITFTATSSGDNAVTPTFTWTINGSTVRRGSTISYRFPATGVYQVQLTAAGSDDSAGAADPLFITVGTARYKGTPKPGGTKLPAPHQTPSPAPSSPTTGSQPTPAGGGSGPTGTPSASSAAGSTTGSSTASPHGQTPGAVAPSPQPHSSATPRSDSQPLVHGRLIAATTALGTTSGAVLDESPLGVAPAAPVSGGWRAPALLGWVAAIMLLFAAGAMRERRRTRRPRSVVSAR